MPNPSLRLVRLSLRRLAHGLLIRVKHPKRVACLNCGFLSLGEAEVTAADRLMLSAKGAGACPDLEVLHCSRSLWVRYDLFYSGTNAEGIFEELEVDRRDCAGFLRHRPGWTPFEHRDLLSKTLEARQKITFAVVGSLLTLFAAWLTKQLGIR